jgi:hypothetical protein
MKCGAGFDLGVLIMIFAVTSIKADNITGIVGGLINVFFVFAPLSFLGFLISKLLEKRYGPNSLLNQAENL